MKRDQRKPRIATLLLRLSLPRQARQPVIADLEEEFRTEILSTKSHGQARLWYWREALSLMRWYLLSRLQRTSHRRFQRPFSAFLRRERTSMARARGLLGSVAQDVLFGMRALRRRPTFLIVGIATLGLGIGAATTMFSVVDGVLLRRLPFNDPGRLVNVWITHADWLDHPFFSDYWDKGPLEWSDYERWRDTTTQFSSVAVHSDIAMTLTGLGDPVQLSVGLASAGLFQTLGVFPQIGRTFLPGEDGKTAARVVLLGHPLWRTRFAADPDVVGSTLTLDGIDYTVVGVLPAGFRLRTLLLGNTGSDGERAAWIPLGQPEILGGLSNQRMEALGRLAQGVSVEQARAETANLFASEEAESPLGARLVHRKDDVTGNYRTPLFLLLGAAGVLLVAACSNVAMLAIGEAASRRLEISTRAALGAGTARILRQALTESVLIGLLGSGLGVFIAFAGTATLVSLSPPIPRLDSVHVSIRVLLFACTTGVISGVLFGLAPSAIFAHDAGSLGLRQGGNRITGGGRRMQRAVVTLQIALTTVLLVSSGLLTRSLSNLLAVEPGLSTTNLATFHVPLPDSRYQTGADATQFFLNVQQRLEVIPGVIRASGTASLPFGPSFMVETPAIRFQIVGGEIAEGEPPPSGWRGVTLPRFNETLGIPVLAGREFTDADEVNAPKVVLVNEAMAHRYWLDENPVGSTLEIGEDEWTVVGVVGDVHYAGLELDVEPMMYLPHKQQPTQALSFVVRTMGEPLQLLPQLRQAVWSVDERVPITRENTMASLVAESGSDERYRTLLMMVFAVAAVVVATGGVFSVTAQSVERQTRELGIRLALGARAERLLSMVLKSSIAAALLGVASGLLVALWATRILSRFLFGVAPWDPATYALVAALMTAVCAGASVLPARRASRVDPVEVLKTE